MKKTIFVITLLLSSFAFKTASAQVRVGINANIGIQPQWGPEGYDYVNYYYMPDIDVFYNVPKRQYIYSERGRWIFANSLPPQYNNFDLYNSYKVVVNENRPYRNADSYRKKYAGFKGNRQQVVIRNSHDSRYFSNKSHPEHEKWQKERNEQNRNDRGNKGHKGHQ
jgi:hypothetical protein